MTTTHRLLSKQTLGFTTAALLAGCLATPATGQLTTLLTDGFGDADRNNNGIDQFDWDLNEGGVLNNASQALPADQGYVPPNFPGALIAEVDTPTDASDVGIRWQGAGGFTSGANADTGLFAAKIYNRIFDDSAGVAPEAVTIDSGLALGLNSKGRGTTLTGFFGQNVALGQNVGDQVKVSLDLRLWDSSPNLNSPATPAKADLRFGLYEDTDNQLGQTNSFAGPAFGSAVWGQDDGSLDGLVVGPSAAGDHGWATRIKIGPDYPADGADAPTPSGGTTGPRIFEETNDGAPGVQSRRIMQGSDIDIVASPDDLNPNFTSILQGKVYNLSLTLERTANSIFATYGVENLTDGTSFSFGGEESLTDNTTLPGSGGIQSEAWDYFALRISSANSFNETDYDLVIDNFLLETGAAAVGITGDFNGSGQVEQGDLDLVLQNWGDDTAANGIPAGWINDNDQLGQIEQTELDRVLQNWGSTTAPDFAGSSVPEPATLALLSLGGLAMLRRRQR